MKILVSGVLMFAIPSLAAEPLPAWAGRSPRGDPVRIAVAAPANPRFAHLAWPKAVRTADGTIVLGYLAGSHHGDESCPAVSISSDGGQSFTAPHILREFGPGKEYTNSGNMALGIAHDGALILLAHGHTKDTSDIFGWRSSDNGRTWNTINTSALGPNKTGSSTGAIIQLPGRVLMVAGHYRAGSKPFSTGIWQSISRDDGLTWDEPAMVNELNVVEPVLVRSGNRLLVFARGRGPDSAKQFISISDDWGQTWRTELAGIGAVTKTAGSLAHPCAMVNPYDRQQIIAVTFERPAPGSAQLWRGDAATLAFKWDRTLLELPKIEGDKNTDFGYAWLLPTENRKALMFYYHGKARGECPIWVLETEL